MATRDETAEREYANDLAALRKTTAHVKRLRAQLRQAEKDARPVVANALKSGLAAGASGFRTEVQQASPFSPPIVRQIGEENGIPPDERYVRTPKGD